MPKPKNPSPDMTPAYGDCRQVAQYLNIPEYELKRMRRDGGGPPYIRVGVRKILYSLAEADAWMKAKQVECMAQEDPDVLKRATPVCDRRGKRATA